PGAGSIVIDGEGVGTITDDDTRYPIWQIQGSGAFSPLVPGATLNANSPGQANVPVRAAVVTAVKYRATDNTQEGFFIQTLPGEDDGDAATSEGLFVFRSVTANVPAVAVGDLVEVTGTMSEYFGMTEISPPNTAGSVVILGSGNPLPAAVEFSEASGLPSTDVDDLSCPGSGPGGIYNEDTNFECFESMLISIPEAIALRGSNRRAPDDIYAELQFSPRASRALREEGVLYPQSPEA